MADEDTNQIIKAGLIPPNRQLHTWIGIAVGSAAMFWGLAITAIVLTAEAQDVPPQVVSGLVAGAVTTSVVAVVVSVSVALWRAMIRNHMCLREGQKEVREQLDAIRMEQVRTSERLDQWDRSYWQAYSDVAADMLTKE